MLSPSGIMRDGRQALDEVPSLPTISGQERRRQPPLPFDLVIILPCRLRFSHGRAQISRLRHVCWTAFTVMV
jgi:hypothetical protein